jgi:hypothetical protein
MDTITPWSMGCIIAVTLGSKNLTKMRPLVEDSTHLDEKGHCLATLLSVVILSLSGKPEFLEQNASGTSFKKSPYPSMFLSDYYNNEEDCS